MATVLEVRPLPQNTRSGTPSAQAQISTVRRMLQVALLLPAIAFGSPVCTVVGVGSAGVGTGTVTPTVHASTQSGDLLLFYGQAATGTEISNIDPAGFTLLSNLGANNGEIWAKISTGSETSASISFDGSTRTAAFIVTLRSTTGWPSLGGIVVHSSTGANTATGIRYRSLTITNDETCAIQFGSHNMTTGATNVASSVTPSSGFTAAGFATEAVNSGIVLAAQLQSQTAATNLAQNTVTVNTNSDSTTSRGASFALAMNSATPPDTTVCSSGCDQPNTTTGIGNAISAGGIIEFRTSPPGSSETWNAKIDCSGQDDWAIRVRDGDTVRIDGPTDFGVRIDNCDRWKVAGNTTGTSGLELGDPADWRDSSAGGQAYPADQQIYVSNSSVGVFRNITVHGGTSFYANDIDRTNSNIKIDNAHFSLHGSNNPGTGSAGDLLRFGAHHSIVENSLFDHGGHNNFDSLGHHQIIRSNVFDGDWTDLATGSPGVRPAIFTPGNRDHWNPSGTDTTEFGFVYSTGNIFKNANATQEIATNPCVKMQGFAIMSLGDYFFDCVSGHMINGPGYGEIGAASGEVMSRVHVAHATAYATQGLWYNHDGSFTSSMGDANQQYDKFFNNIVAETDNNGEQPHSVLFRSLLAADGVNLNGHANGWKSSMFDSNIINGPSANKQFKLIAPEGTTTVSWTNTAQWPNNVNRNEDTSVTFVDTGTVGNRTKSGFALDVSSPVGIGDAVSLTTTTDSGTNDTTLTLADPYWFTDGWGISLTAIGEAAELGDCVAVGATSGTAATAAQITRISLINYSTGAIVVSPGVNHANGSKVWKATNNSDTTCGTVWDNRGAGQ